VVQGAVKLILEPIFEADIQEAHTVIVLKEPPMLPYRCSKDYEINFGQARKVVSSYILPFLQTYPLVCISFKYL